MSNFPEIRDSVLIGMEARFKASAAYTPEQKKAVTYGFDLLRGAQSLMQCDHIIEEFSEQCEAGKVPLSSKGVDAASATMAVFRNIAGKLANPDPRDGVWVAQKNTDIVIKKLMTTSRVASILGKLQKK